MRGLRDPETGATIVLDARRREDVPDYNGPFEEDAPDIYLTIDLHYRPFDSVRAPALVRTIGTDDQCGTGYHRPEGIIVGAGEGIGRGTVQGSKLVDILPTLLYLFGRARARLPRRQGYHRPLHAGIP